MEKLRKEAGHSSFISGRVYYGKLTYEVCLGWVAYKTNQVSVPFDKPQRIIEDKRGDSNGTVYRKLHA